MHHSIFTHDCSEIWNCVPKTQNVCERGSLGKSINNMQSVPETQLVVNIMCIF